MFLALFPPQSGQDTQTTYLPTGLFIQQREREREEIEREEWSEVALCLLSQAVIILYNQDILLLQIKGREEWIPTASPLITVCQ